MLDKPAVSSYFAWSLTLQAVSCVTPSTPSLELVRPANSLTTIHLKEAYFHVKIGPKHRMFLCFTLQGIACEYNSLPSKSLKWYLGVMDYSCSLWAIPSEPRWTVWQQVVWGLQQGTTMTTLAVQLILWCHWDCYTCNKLQHINLLKLQTVLLVLQHFKPLMKGKSVGEE